MEYFSLLTRRIVARREKLSLKLYSLLLFSPLLSFLVRSIGTLAGVNVRTLHLRLPKPSVKSHTNPDIHNGFLI